MFSKKPLKIFLFPAASILLAFFLWSGFFIAAQNVVQTFPIAHMNALNYLKPQRMNYFWDLNIHNAPIDRSRILFYMDYYENLLQVYPCLRDAYGILGYGYYYLGDDAKAIDYLKKAIAANPLYSWNYYNLGAVYVSQSRYHDAFDEFQKLQLIDPQKSLQRMLASEDVYLPLIEAGKKGFVQEAGSHLKLSYRVAFDLVQLLNRSSYNKDIEGVVKKVKLELYAF